MTTFPALVGTKEAADLLGVTKQRINQLRRQMPEPVAVLASGPVWTEDAIKEYAEYRKRTSGPEHSKHCPCVTRASK